MVPMTKIGEMLLKDLRHTLERDLQTIAHSSQLIQAFSMWVRHTSTFQKHRWNLDDFAVTDGGPRSYQDVAVLGYVAQSGGYAQPEVSLALATGLKWLIGRPAFSPNRTPSFEVDGVALLGLALGTKSVDDNIAQEVRVWLLGFIPRSLETPRLDAWTKTLITGAASVAGLSLAIPLDEETADLRLALECLGISFSGANSESDESIFLSSVSKYGQQAEGRSPEKSAARLTALEVVTERLKHLNFAKPTLADVMQLLRGSKRALRRWTWETTSRTGGRNTPPVKWEILSEYQVQNLLWFLLAPVFPDLEDEENLPSVGHKHPRCDLGIPSLNLIIEVKFIRRNNQAEFSAVVEQVAADANLYLLEPTKYNKIIAFVWDNTMATEQHDELTRGLERISGVAGAVVVPRPAKMAP